LTVSPSNFTVKTSTRPSVTDAVHEPVVDGI